MFNSNNNLSIKKTQWFTFKWKYNNCVDLNNTCQQDSGCKREIKLAVWAQSLRRASSQRAAAAWDAKRDAGYELTTRYVKFSLSYRFRVLGRFLKIRFDQKHRHSISNSSLLWDLMEALEWFKVKCDPMIKQNWMEWTRNDRALGPVWFRFSLFGTGCSVCRHVCLLFGRFTCSFYEQAPNWAPAG